MSANLSWNSPTPLRLRAGVGALVLGLHAAGFTLIALASSRVVPPPPPVVVSVRFVDVAPVVQQVEAPPPPKPEPPKPVPPKPKPKPVVKKVEPPREPLPVSDTALSAPPPDPTPPAPPAPAAPAAPAQPAAVPAPAPAAPPPNVPRQMGQVEYTYAPQPTYPRMSMRMGESGTVVIRVVINVRGTVDKADVAKSSGFDRLDAAALEAVRHYKFKPPSENGVPFIGIADVPINFNLSSKD